jgi:hypothetical protein
MDGKKNRDDFPGQSSPGTKAKSLGAAENR